MNLGFVGTGKIASSVITGICKSKISYKKIVISPRNKKIAELIPKKTNFLTSLLNIPKLWSTFLFNNQYLIKKKPVSHMAGLKIK